MPCISEPRSSAITLWKGAKAPSLPTPTNSDTSPRSSTSHPRSPPCYDSDSDAAPTHSFATALRLRASIAAAPDHRLREIMVRLVDRSPGFQHAVAKELLPSVPAPAAPPSPRRKRRRLRRTSDTASTLAPPQQKCANCGKRFGDVRCARHEESCNFHPGHLQDEVYEFLSRTPEGHSFKVIRTITMWSCCDEDAWGPGCAVAPAHVGETSEQRHLDRCLVGDPEIP